jgi:hypothetical protein
MNTLQNPNVPCHDWQRITSHASASCEHINLHEKIKAENPESVLRWLCTKCWTVEYSVVSDTLWIFVERIDSDCQMWWNSCVQETSRRYVCLRRPCKCIFTAESNIFPLDGFVVMELIYTTVLESCPHAVPPSSTSSREGPWKTTLASPTCAPSSIACYGLSTAFRWWSSRCWSSPSTSPDVPLKSCISLYIWYTLEGIAEYVS